MRKRVALLEPCPVCSKPMVQVREGFQACFDPHTGLLPLMYQEVEVDEEKAKEKGGE